MAPKTMKTKKEQAMENLLLLTPEDASGSASLAPRKGKKSHAISSVGSGTGSSYVEMHDYHDAPVPVRFDDWTGEPIYSESMYAGNPASASGSQYRPPQAIPAVAEFDPIAEVRNYHNCPFCALSAESCTCAIP